MNTSNLFNEFVGNENKQEANKPLTGMSNFLGKIINNLTGGLIGSGTAGSIIALLINNKPEKKLSGTAATYGGAAVLGGLAFKSFKTWQLNHKSKQSTDTDHDYKDIFYAPHEVVPEFELKLIKAMITASKADGHIDAQEQQRIFQAVAQMNISNEIKSTVFDLLNHPASVDEIVLGVHDTGQKSELFFAACLVSDPQLPSVKVYLDQLAYALALPENLKQQIIRQAQGTINEVN
ncbi:MAG: tellurite resistance TerB family protein [Gammaproteobacteria bacterium]|nr:tellurite resistance TerB family protein [Gammaproteobacteria bacterium]